MKSMVRLGEDVKIQCPISGNPTPIIEWKKGGETIDYTFIRIRTKGRQLRIKKSQETDTGVFICKGVNGFGNVEVRVDLIVIGKLEKKPFNLLHLQDMPHFYFEIQHVKYLLF